MRPFATDDALHAHHLARERVVQLDELVESDRRSSCADDPCRHEDRRTEKSPAARRAERIGELAQADRKRFGYDD